jgi:hypothetical protein
MKYVDASKSPKNPEALTAAWRFSTDRDLQVEQRCQKAADSTARAISTTKKITTQFADVTDWATRAERLQYLVQSEIPTYGNSLQ